MTTEKMTRKTCEKCGSEEHHIDQPEGGHGEEIYSCARCGDEWGSVCL
jgi:DNA-directed RNA polymerase subunit M/transcription elongation factor TFIIS